MKRFLMKVSAVIGFVSVVPSLAHATELGCSQGNVVELAEKAEFSTLVAAIDAAGLRETLEDAKDITVFAPTNKAFDSLPPGVLDSLLANKDALTNVLTYHVVGAKVPASIAIKLTEATMLNGKKVAIRYADKKLFINNSRVIKADVKACNGIIHVIDAVLVP